MLLSNITTTIASAITLFLNTPIDKVAYIDTTVNAVCAKALKERNVELLNRANYYLLSH